MTDQTQTPTEPIQSQTNTGTTETPQVQSQKATFDYASSGNKSLDAALKILGRNGIAPDTFEMQQARNGDFGPLRAVLNYAGVEDADIALSLMEGAYNEYTTQAATSKEAVMKTAISEAGGQEQWDAVLQFIDANADPDESEELVNALEAGGTQAKLAIRYMNLLYQAFGQQEQSEEEVEEAPRTGFTQSAPSAGATLTAQEFAVQYQRLMAQGYRENSPQVVRLQQQRLAAIRGR